MSNKILYFDNTLEYLNFNLKNTIKSSTKNYSAVIYCKMKYLPRYFQINSDNNISNLSNNIKFM